MKTPYLLAGGAAVLALAAAVFVPASSVRNYGSLALNSAVRPAMAAAPYADISWDDLVPKGWDPFAQLPKGGSEKLLDSSPEASRLYAQMQKIFDEAPTVAAMNGRKVRLPGYVVPLESGAGELREFLLVPYFGACIHTPPPPANQIIHVRTDKPAKGLGPMAAVWVSGTLATSRSGTNMGTSGYELRLDKIEPYVARKR